MSAGLVIAVLIDTPMSTSAALGVAILGRVADVVSTVRVLGLVAQAAESAPGIEGKPRPWTLTRLGLAQVFLLAVSSAAIHQISPPIAAYALLAIGIGSIAISIANYTVIVASIFESFFDLTYLNQFAPPQFHIPPPTTGRTVSAIGFILSIPLAWLVMEGLTRLDESIFAVATYVFSVVSAHSFFVLAQYLYFTYPELEMRRIHRAARGALAEAPLIADRFVKYPRSKSARSILSLPPEALTEIIRQFKHTHQLGLHSAAVIQSDMQAIQRNLEYYEETKQKELWSRIMSPGTEPYLEPREFHRSLDFGDYPERSRNLLDFCLEIAELARQLARVNLYCQIEREIGDHLRGAGTGIRR